MRSRHPAVTGQINPFVSAYAKIWFSHDEDQICLSAIYLHLRKEGIWAIQLICFHGKRLSGQNPSSHTCIVNAIVLHNTLRHPTVKAAHGNCCYSKFRVLLPCSGFHCLDPGALIVLLYQLKRLWTVIQPGNACCMNSGHQHADSHIMLHLNVQSNLS